MDINQKKLVLVVDDIATNNILIRAILRGSDYNVITAQSGIEALKLAEDRHPDIVLLDIMMPGMDGYEVLARLKASENTSDIKVIMLTALAEQSDFKNAMDLGADGYLTKPVIAASLFEALDRFKK